MKWQHSSSAQSRHIWVRLNFQSLILDNVGHLFFILIGWTKNNLIGLLESWEGGILRMGWVLIGVRNKESANTQVPRVSNNLQRQKRVPLVHMTWPSPIPATLPSPRTKAKQTKRVHKPRQHYKQTPRKHLPTERYGSSVKTIVQFDCFRSTSWYGDIQDPQYVPSLLSGKQSPAYLLLMLPSCESACYGKKGVARWRLTRRENLWDGWLWLVWFSRSEADIIQSDWSCFLVIFLTLVSWKTVAEIFFHSGIRIELDGVEDFYAYAYTHPKDHQVTLHW